MYYASDLYEEYKTWLNECITMYRNTTDSDSKTTWLEAASRAACLTDLYSRLSLQYKRRV